MQHRMMEHYVVRARSMLANMYFGAEIHMTLVEYSIIL